MSNLCLCSCGCHVHLQEFDYDLKEFVIEKNDHTIIVTPADLDQQEEMLKDLKQGSCPCCNKWEDGNGNTIRFPDYQIRCSCNKLLATAKKKKETFGLEIKCPKCKKLNTI